ITIKAHAIRLVYKAKDGKEYILNLIDTPGHVDFSYEVSRSLVACEGALLVVDAAQGVEAQTLANVYLAMENNLEVIPVINKIDLPNADIERTKTQIEDILGIDAEDAILISAKHGMGIEEVLEAIIQRIPPPKGDPSGPLKALIFDSWFDSYQGAVAYVRLYDGALKEGMQIKMMAHDKIFEVSQVGVLRLDMIPTAELSAGSVGYFIAGIKQVSDTKVGDTVTEADNPTPVPLPGFKHVKPMVFSGLYPVVSHEYEALRDALEKLRLNDSAFSYEPETSAALGFGFRCGFLGLLHMEIVQERLEREFGLTLVTTAPSVVYRVMLNDGTMLDVDNPTKLPPPNKFEWIEEPYVVATILVPADFVGNILKLAQE
ncbi:MAG: translation elongation factor 4, partial [Nitrospira sp.]|nr:translation elongation factor 4 [Nitrospira sp.]